MTWAHRLRVPSFLVGMTMPFWRAAVVPGLPGEVAVFGLTIVVASFVRPTRRNAALPWVALLLGAMVAFVVAVSLMMGQPWLQRSVRITLLFLFAWTVAVGRVHWKSVVAGGVVGLVLINAPAFYLGLTPNEYPPYLTGWLVDKNVAGMYYAALGVLGLALFRVRWHQLAFFLGMFALCWLTGSRTSLAGAVAGLVWWLLRDRLGLLARLGGVGLGIWALTFFEDRFSQVGAFADREGTDLLREAVHAAEQAKVARTAWYGRGFNTAWVDVRGVLRMWFHDSYAALRVEGGLPMLIIVLVVFVGVALGLLSTRRRVGPDLRAAEAALIVVLVCAWQLGEVFFSSLAFFILGVALYERYGVSAVPPDPLAKPGA